MLSLLVAHKDVPVWLILLLIHRTVLILLNMVITMHMQDMMPVVKVLGIHPHTVNYDAPPIRGNDEGCTILTLRAHAHIETHIKDYLNSCRDVLVGPVPH